jgi:DNA polymerase delta subunit 1
MAGSDTNEDIKVSSQPFEPGSTMKKRKTTHNKSNSNKNGSQAPTFEEELKLLTEDMDVDIKC